MSEELDLEQVFAGVRIKFWKCRLHKEPTSHEQPVIVEWIGDVAVCKVCGNTSQIERVRALLERWERSLKDPYGIWDRATKVRELRAALKGGDDE